MSLPSPINRSPTQNLDTDMDDLAQDDITKLVFSDLAAVTMVPRRLTEIASWHEHIPFASWLIRQIRPARFVELGVHKGDSYSAFCQAVAEAELPTVCFGIDTWQGEEHAGMYDDSIWQEFSEYHSQHYATFSRLVRSTFDDALPYFEDGSVDLLHIDGRHFYDDVKHDFESWFPKLSPSAVVLFHDINVRERNFGVWRFWDELCSQYPSHSFSFVHGHGLGILFPGSTPPPLSGKLCALNAAGVRYVRNAFAALGKSAARQAQVAYALRQIETLRGQASELESLKAKRADYDAAQANASIDEAVNLQGSAEITQLVIQQSLPDKEKGFEAAESLIDTHQESARLAEASVPDFWLHQEELELLVVQLQAQIALLEKAQSEETLNAEAKLSAMVGSRSWRLTSPLRKFARTLKQVIKYRRSLNVDRILISNQSRSDYFSNSDLEQIRNSALFNTNYYINTYPDIRIAGVDPAKHYLVQGWLENRDPSADFSTSHYLSDNADVSVAGINPLLHFVQHGQSEGRVIRPSTSVTESGGEHEPSNHLPNVTLKDELNAGVRIREEDGRDVDAEDSIVEEEIKTIKSSGLFDESYYRSLYPDTKTTADQVRHYCETGWKEGKNPSDDFDTDFYLGIYSDIKDAGINPLWHYIVAGASEQRAVIPEASVRFEDDVRFGTIRSDIKLVALYSSSNVSRNERANSNSLAEPLNLEDRTHDDRSGGSSLINEIDLAKRHGLHGFCFSLESGDSTSDSCIELQDFLVSDQNEFGFCLQFAIDLPDTTIREVLMDAVSDQRYIRIERCPIIVIRMKDEFPQISCTRIENLKRLFKEYEQSDPYLIACWSTAATNQPDATLRAHFDAALDYSSEAIPTETGVFTPLHKNGKDLVPYRVIASEGVERALRAQYSVKPMFQVITTARESTAQKSGFPLTYTRFNLKDYRRWLDSAFDSARRILPDDRRLVFLNGWNNWREGLFIAPDRRGGFSRLNLTTSALIGTPQGAVMPKVSVIVPNYNHEAFLRRRLSSIYGQTYKNIEVILLDDCSSDQSRVILTEYAAAYPEITRAIFNTTNSGGPFRQWATGIKAATGDIVWIAESDDFCEEHFLESLVPCFNDEAVMLAYAKCVFVNRDGSPMRDEFKIHIGDLACAAKWSRSYVETAHNEVINALGIKNTIPNASGVVFKRPVEMPLLEDEAWLSMRVAGDWVFYLHLIRGGKIAFSTEASNFFRRYDGSAAETTYNKESFYREVGMASRTAAALYDTPETVIQHCRDACKKVYDHRVGQSNEEFERWYDYEAVLRARASRLPTIMVSTMGFYPGGAEILPIRLANEFKRQGLSVLLLSAGLNPKEDGIRRMVRRDVPVIETSSITETESIIRNFGIEVLNTHQWHIQKYPFHTPDVFSGLCGHVASLHGMIEHGDAFGMTRSQLEAADRGVSTWVFTADKNISPFKDVGLYDPMSQRFVKLSNGMQPPQVIPRFRSTLGIPEDAFALCCVSRAIVDKGWTEMMEVVARARELSGRDIRLVLVGNGPIFDDYCRDGVPDFVHLIGFSEDSVGHYAACDMGIMLTRFKSESFPLTILDCLFAGKPYFASDVGEIRNMLTIDQEIAGDVIPLDDWQVPIEEAAQVVARFASDKHQYEKALKRVEELAKRYRIDKVASQYIDLFKRDFHNTLRLRAG